MQIKLLPTDEQANALLETIERFNEACNYIADMAFKMKAANKYRLQKEFYAILRKRFGLSAQMAVRAIGKTVEAYKRDKSKRVQFRQYGAMVYDDRILSWKGPDRVSILSLQGRLLVPLVYGSYHKPQLRRVRGQADLVYRDGMFFLLQTIDVPEPPTDDVTDYIGVDLGIVNIATDSKGEVHSGGTVNGLRKRHVKLRAKLQSKDTKATKRLLKKRRRKETRFARDINHKISKQLVAKAKALSKGIALEDLKGIRERITVRKSQRRIQHSWSFFQLRAFLEYKAKLAGVPLIFVDPKNTSRTCPECGTISKKNRKTQAEFKCIQCGFSGHADTIAAENIRRVAVNQPHVDVALAASYKPTALAVGS